MNNILKRGSKEIFKELACCPRTLFPRKIMLFAYFNYLFYFHNFSRPFIQENPSDLS